MAASKNKPPTWGNDFSLHRSISWRGAFWVVSGVPALVLFSMGAIAVTVGQSAWLIWLISISFGFIQAFSYAEVAGLFPHKTGGASVYGAVAWANYNKFLAPLSGWCSWLAWGPVLAIGSGLAAGYMLTELFATDAVIRQWQIILFDLSVLNEGLSLRIDATFIIGAVLMLLMFAIQNGGIVRSVRATMILGVMGLAPLILVAIIPLVTGDIPREHFFPLLSLDLFDSLTERLWNKQNSILLAGALFLAGWSTYAFETAVCYTREFKNPRKDTFKAIIYSGLLCIVAFTLIPVAFQAHMGIAQTDSTVLPSLNGELLSVLSYNGLSADSIYSGMGVANALSGILAQLGDSALWPRIFVGMLVLALLLSIMTAIFGSSRTLYQGSVDGFLPKFLSHVNEEGVPTSAMWTNLIINLVLLSLSDYVFLLAVSCVSYIIFNFINLNATWIHRLDRPDKVAPNLAGLNDESM